MSDKKEVQSITAEDMLKLIKEMSASNQEFAKTLAQTIANPPKSDEELERRQRAMQDKIELARMEESTKEERRKFCVAPATAQAPHRRSGTRWGQFNGTSVIAWGFQEYAYRDTDGKMKLTPPQPVGVCQWCGTTFSPGSPGYEEAISWGLSDIYGTFPINRNSGQWE